MYRPLLIVSLASVVLAAAQSPDTFKNPEFRSQDPWVIQWNGNYYYSESNHDVISIRKSSTLTGLSRAAGQTVWSPAMSGSSTLTNVWAPEIHILNGRWYLYFSADQQKDGRKRLYVLQGGTDPLDNYSIGNTGLPNGMLADSTGLWAIDPDVFYGTDQKLYLTWSCADNQVGGTPQSLCLARMGDPLHIESATVRIAKPDAAWEMRTAMVEEGPVGFTRNGNTYITYSGSASWTTNDYNVGLLINTTGDLLNPAAWVKSGQIFDHHAGTYGPGSVVFVSSPDGTETWNVYHAYDQLGCQPWSCRSIRIQKVSWSPEGLPLLGYPLDPYVSSSLPSGDDGSPTGWGKSLTGTVPSGDWTYHSSSSADSQGMARGLDAGQTFRGSSDMLAWSVSADVAEQQHSVVAQSTEYGIYALYSDDADWVQTYLDPVWRVFGARASVHGNDWELISRPLPPGFDTSAAHTLRVDKSSARVFTFFLDGVQIDAEVLPLDHGQIGAYTRGVDAQFRNVSVVNHSFGWGDAQGDAAEGFAKLNTAIVGSGYTQGLWNVTGPGSLTSVMSSAGLNTIYRENPVLGDYRVQAEARSQTAYGLIACHDDRNNQITLWIDPVQQSADLISVIHGTYTSQPLRTLTSLDQTHFHRLAARKAGSLFTFYVDDVVVGEQVFDLASGTVGVASDHEGVEFRNFVVH